MATGVKDLGNGLGYIYITEEDGTSIVDSIVNTKVGASEALLGAARSFTLNRNRVAYGIVGIDAVEFTADTVNSVSVNGVNQITAFVYSGNDEADFAKTLAEEINSHTAASGVNYTAKASGTNVYLYATEAAADTVNTHVIGVTNTGGLLTTTLTDVDNGVDASNFYTDFRYFINADYGTGGYPGFDAASIGDLTNAVEITDDIIPKTLSSKIHTESVTISSGVATLTRKTNFSVAIVDGEGGASDALDSIHAAGFVNGDIVAILTASTSNVITVNGTSVDGNIRLVNSVDYVSPSSGDVFDGWLVLQYENGIFWETDRRQSDLAKPTYETFRDFGYPFNSGGITSAGFPNLNTINYVYELTPDSSNSVLNFTADVLTTTPPPTLFEDLYIEYKDTNVLDGDRFLVTLYLNLNEQDKKFTVGSTEKKGGTVLSSSQLSKGIVAILSIYAGSQWNHLFLPNYVYSTSAPGTEPKFELETQFIKDANVTKPKCESDVRQSSIQFQAEVHGSGDYGSYKAYVPYAGSLDEVVAHVADQFSHDMVYDITLNDVVIAQAVPVASATAIGASTTTSLAVTLAAGDILGVRLFIKGATPATTGKINFSFKIDRE